MTDALPAPAPTSSTEPEPELELNPPPGVQLDYPTEGAVRVRVEIPMSARLLLRVPRALVLACVVAVMIQAWRHRWFIVFFFFGMPFLRWLRGSVQTALVIGERSLEVEGSTWFGGGRSIPRFGIASVSIGRAGALRMWQRALLVRDKDQQTIPLLVGISPMQAEFVHSGLERWLAGEG